MIHLDNKELACDSVLCPFDVHGDGPVVSFDFDAPLRELLALDMYNERDRHTKRAGRIEIAELFMIRFMSQWRSGYLQGIVV